MSAANRISVEFQGVGRSKKSWTVVVPLLANGQPCPMALERSVRKSGALMSSDIYVDCDDSLKSGSVIVGGMRPVGTWKVTA